MSASIFAGWRPGRRAFVDQRPARPQQQQAVEREERRRRRLMDHRDATHAALRERLERPHERHRRDGVQATRRLVQKQQRRVAAEPKATDRRRRWPPAAALALARRPTGVERQSTSPKRSASSLTFWSHSSESDAWPVLNRTASRSDSSTVRQGVSRSSCGTNEATRRIVPASNGAPFTSTEPLVGVAAPETHSKRVVLPEPLGPMTATLSAGPKWPLTSSRMRFVWSLPVFTSRVMPVNLTCTGVVAEAASTSSSFVNLYV